MSSTWGFPEGSPEGCPAGCDCKCYDCLDTTGKCTCGFDGGFCASMPAQFLVDYVRVYQVHVEATKNKTTEFDYEKHAHKLHTKPKPN